MLQCVGRYLIVIKMQIIIDESYIGLKRIDYNAEDQTLCNVIFHAKAIENGEDRVVKLYLPYE